MKILFLTRIYHPYTGGAATNYKFYFDKFIKKNFNISVITSQKKSNKFLENQDGHKIYRTIINFQNKETLIKKIFFLFLSNLSAYLTYFLMKFKFNKFDIIQIHSDFLFLKKGKYINHSIHIFKKLALKSILDIRDLSSCPKSDIGFDYYLVNSINTYNKAKLNITPKKLKLIYSPLVLNRQKKINYSKRRNILFIGSISLQKGVKELINATSLVSKKFPDIELNLYGEKFNNFEYNPYTHYYGPVKHAEAIELIRSCEILVLPSFLESLPRVIIEAMYLNKKVLVSHCSPELTESLNDDYLIKNINPNEISKKIINLLNSNVKVNYNYDFKKHNDIHIINQIEKVYRKLFK